ncbi:MRG/MORF4L-binding protein-like [Ciona intestinalis]
METGYQSQPRINWNSETEVCLFYAMRGQKPIGINKHFHMMCIHKKFCQSIGQTVSSDQLWQHLSTMYNLKVLDESEVSPFKNIQKEFKLPPSIINSKKNNGKSVEEVNQDDEGIPLVTHRSKTNRKRTRQTLSNTSSPSSPSVGKRRR